jgi:hypothetical protein
MFVCLPPSFYKKTTRKRLEFRFFVLPLHPTNHHQNMNTVSLNHLWSYLQGLSLTASNQRWLAAHLMEAAESAESKGKKKELVFPKIPKDYKPSAKVLAMTCGPLPKGFDLEKELDEMWEERAK